MKRRTFLQHTSVVGGTSLLSAAAGFNIIGKALPEKPILGHGDYRYRMHTDWSQLDPAKTPVFNCHEMVMDQKGRLIMITDEIKNNLIIFDKSGKYIDSWGSWFPGGHGLSLASEGEEDFLYVTDCGWFFGRDQKWHKQAGRVLKMTTDGRLLFSIGHPATIGVYKEDEVFMPTEVAVAPNGDFYVADGYGSDYILQYDYKGQFIRKFGGHHNEDANANLKNAHGITVDTRDPENPVLICTSRTENCFKYFSMEGEYIRTVELPALYVCRPVIDETNIYAGVCWSKTHEGKGWVDNTGFVTILDGDEVVSNPGGTAPEYKDGQLQQMFKEGTHFYHCHDVCVDEDKNLYICQWKAEKTYPVKLERV